MNKIARYIFAAEQTYPNSRQIVNLTISDDDLRKWITDYYANNPINGLYDITVTMLHDNNSNATIEEDRFKKEMYKRYIEQYATKRGQNSDEFIAYIISQLFPNNKPPTSNGSKLIQKIKELVYKNKIFEDAILDKINDFLQDDENKTKLIAEMEDTNSTKIDNDDIDISSTNIDISNENAKESNNNNNNNNNNDNNGNNENYENYNYHDNNRNNTNTPRLVPRTGKIFLNEFIYLPDLFAQEQLKRINFQEYFNKYCISAIIYALSHNNQCLEIAKDLEGLEKPENAKQIRDNKYSKILDIVLNNIITTELAGKICNYIRIIFNQIFVSEVNSLQLLDAVVRYMQSPNSKICQNAIESFITTWESRQRKISNNNKQISNLPLTKVKKLVDIDSLVAHKDIPLNEQVQINLAGYFNNDHKLWVVINNDLIIEGKDGYIAKKYQELINQYEKNHPDKQTNAYATGVILSSGSLKHAFINNLYGVNIYDVKEVLLHNGVDRVYQCEQPVNFAMVTTRIAKRLAKRV